MRIYEDGNNLHIVLEENDGLHDKLEVLRDLVWETGDDEVRERAIHFIKRLYAKSTEGQMTLKEAQ